MRALPTKTTHDLNAQIQSNSLLLSRNIENDPCLCTESLQHINKQTPRIVPLLRAHIHKDSALLQDFERGFLDATQTIHRPTAWPSTATAVNLTVPARNRTT